jgi:hypothetical protein
LAENINQATRAFYVLARAGLAPWCPQWSCFSGGAMVSPGSATVYAIASVFGDPTMGHEDWMAVDLAWVAVADAVLRLPGDSAGADQEVAEAERLGLPVFHSVADAIRWGQPTA